jgi:regulator of sigma E protease
MPPFLAINWSNVGLQAAQLILALSLLVILHEFGHYITARWFKCRVEKFFLFFDPWFALFKKKVGDTVYGIGWLPLGGYVKIAGMVDESMDKEQLKKPPQSWEFRSKPAWQRLIVMLGGVIMNVLTAFVIYALILMVWGEKKTPMSSLRNGIWVTDSLMYDIGIRNGDRILTVNDDTVVYYEDLNARILLGQRITLERDGQVLRLDIPVNLIERLIESRRRRGMLLSPRVPAYVGAYKAKDTSFGKRAGLREMDRIVAIDSLPVTFYDQMTPLLQQHRNGSVNLTVERGGQRLTLRSQVSAEGKVGIPYLEEMQYAALGTYVIERRHYGVLAAFPAGVRKAGEKLRFYVDQFRMILNPKTGAYKGVGGFKSMGSIFPTSWSWEAFWNITAFLSIVLAFMNLLPIPALDGGHVLFTLWEMITRRKPSEKFLEYAQMAGMILLLGLMLYANGNDWFGWGR